MDKENKIPKELRDIFNEYFNVHIKITAIHIAKEITEPSCAIHDMREWIGHKVFFDVSNTILQNLKNKDMIEKLIELYNEGEIYG